MKNSILYTLGIAILIFASCTKNKTSSTNDKKEDPTPNPKSEVLLTADITFVDENGRKSKFLGEQGKQFVNTNGAIADITEVDGTIALRISSFDPSSNSTIGILVGNKSGNTSKLTPGTYENKEGDDFMVSFSFDVDREMYQMIPIPFHQKYNNEPIMYNGKLIITEITDNRIKGTFSFDGYTLLTSPIKKIESRSGEFDGGLYRNNP